MTSYANGVVFASRDFLATTNRPPAKLSRWLRPSGHSAELVRRLHVGPETYVPVENADEAFALFLAAGEAVVCRTRQPRAG